MPYTYIGEYLLAQHKSTSEKFETLDALTSKTKETLAQVQDFVNMHLKQQVPKQFENVRKSLGQRIDNAEQFLQTSLKELERKTLEEHLPRQKQMLELLDSGLQKLKSDIPVVIDLESQKMMAHVQVAMEHLDKHE